MLVSVTFSNWIMATYTDADAFSAPEIIALAQNDSENRTSENRERERERRRDKEVNRKSNDILPLWRVHLSMNVHLVLVPAFDESIFDQIFCCSPNEMRILNEVNSNGVNKVRFEQNGILFDFVCAE